MSGDEIDNPDDHDGNQHLTARKGWLYPRHLDIPEQCWYRMEFGDSVQWDLDREGHEELARQAGMVELTSEVAAHGVDGEGIVYVVVEATLKLDHDEHGGEYTAVQGADTASQQVREPDYVSGVAESRAIKRVVKRALGIRSAAQEVSSDPEANRSDDGSLNQDAPASSQFDTDNPDDSTDTEAEKTTDKTNDDDDSLTW